MLLQIKSAVKLISYNRAINIKYGGVEILKWRLQQSNEARQYTFQVSFYLIRIFNRRKSITFTFCILGV